MSEDEIDSLLSQSFKSLVEKKDLDNHISYKVPANWTVSREGESSIFSALSDKKLILVNLAISELKAGQTLDSILKNLGDEGFNAKFLAIYEGKVIKTVPFEFAGHLGKQRILSMEHRHQMEQPITYHIDDVVIANGKIYHLNIILPVAIFSRAQGLIDAITQSVKIE